LVNRNAVSIHHVANTEPFCRVAFIFDERRTPMVNRWYAGASRILGREFPGVNLKLNPPCLQHQE
jgi:hypothetical protein